MILIPYKLETTFTRFPIVNAILIGVTSVMFLLSAARVLPDEFVESLVLKDWSIEGMVGSLFLHNGLFHLVGNMLFLWVFGNGVCSTLGNGWYLPLYLFLGICASATGLAAGEVPAVGASGAINGIMGLALVLFPVSRISMWYAFIFFGFVRVGTFRTKGYWMIILWVLFDVVGLFVGHGGVGYGAHLGGLFAGILAGVVLLLTNKVETFDPTLIEIIKGERPDSEEVPSDAPFLADSLRVRHQLSLEEGRSGPEPVRTATLDPETERIHRMMTGEDASAVLSPIVEERPHTSNRTAPPLPFRVLRIAEDTHSMTCYFVYDGEELRDLTVTSQQGLTVTVHPQKTLRRAEPGWFRFIASVGKIPADPGFILDYTLKGERISRSMVVSQYGKRILSGAVV